MTNTSTRLITTVKGFTMQAPERRYFCDSNRWNTGEQSIKYFTSVKRFGTVGQAVVGHAGDVWQTWSVELETV